MAIAHVQTAGNAASGSATNAKAYASANTTGNLLVVAISWATTGRTVSGVADTNSNTWQEAVAKNVDGVALSIWYAMNCAAGANTVTVTFSDTTNSTIAIGEYSGLLTSGALDKTASATAGGSAGTSSSSGSTATTTIATELVYGTTTTAGSSGGFSPGADFTERADTAAIHVEDRVVAAKAAYSASSTWVNSRTWVCQCATFKGVESASVSAEAATTSASEAPVPAVMGGANVGGVVAAGSAAAPTPAVTGGAQVSAELAEAGPAAGCVPSVTGSAPVTLRSHYLGGTVVKPRATATIRQMRLDFGNALHHYNDGAVLTGTAISDDSKDANTAHPVWGDSCVRSNVFVRVVSPVAWGAAASNQHYVSRVASLSDPWIFTALPTTSAPTIASRVRLGIYPKAGATEAYYVWCLDANNDLARCELSYSLGTWSWTDKTPSADIGAIGGAAIHPTDEDKAVIVAYEDPFMKMMHARWDGATWVLNGWHVLAGSDELIWSDAHWSDAEFLPGSTTQVAVVYNSSMWGTAHAVVYDKASAIVSEAYEVLPSAQEWGSLRVWVSGLTNANGKLWAVTRREAMASGTIPMIHHVALASTVDGKNWTDEDFVTISECRGKLLVPTTPGVTADEVFAAGNTTVAKSDMTYKLGYDHPDLKHTVDEASGFTIGHGGASSAPEIGLQVVVDSTEADHDWIDDLALPGNEVSISLGTATIDPQLMATGNIVEKVRQQAFTVDSLQVASLGKMGRILGGEAYVPITAKTWEGPYYLYTEFQFDTGLPQLALRAETGTWVCERVSTCGHYVLHAKKPGIALIPQSIREKGFILRFALDCRVAIEGTGAVFWWVDELNYWWAGLYQDVYSRKLVIRKVVNGVATTLNSATVTTASVEKWMTLFLFVRPGYVEVAWNDSDSYNYVSPTAAVVYNLETSSESTAPPGEYHVGLYVEGFEGFEGADKTGTVTDVDNNWLEDTAQTFESTDVGKWVKVAEQDRRICSYETTKIYVDPYWGAEPRIGDEYGIYTEARKDGPRCYVRELWFCEAALPPTVDDVVDGILALSGVTRADVYTDDAVALHRSSSAPVMGDLDVQVVGDQDMLRLYFWCSYYDSEGANAYSGFLVDILGDASRLQHILGLGASSAPYQTFTTVAYHPSLVDLSSLVDRTMRVVANRDLIVVAVNGRFITAFPNLKYRAEGYVMRPSIYSDSATRRELCDVLESFAWDAATPASAALETLLRGRRVKIVELADGSIGVSRFETPRSDLGVYESQVVALKRDWNVSQLLPVVEVVGAEETGFWLDPEAARMGLKYRRQDNPTVWSQDHAVREAKKATELGLSRYNAGEVTLYAPDPDVQLESEFTLETGGSEYIVDKMEMAYQQSDKNEPSLMCKITGRAKPTSKPVETWDSATAQWDKKDYWG